MINVCNMYPQYQAIPDRRVQTQQVAVDRRSGIDRRAVNRIKLNNNLTKDIFVLRSSVSNSDKNVNKVSDGSPVLSFTQKLQKTLESINSNNNKNTYSTAIKSDNVSSVGMLISGLAAVIGGVLLGIGGLATGIGATVYTSAKSIKNVVSGQFKE